MAGAGIGLLAVLAAGLWRLNRTALAPPVLVGISHGLIFSGTPQPVSSVHESDFDQQLVDSVEVLFSRTEKGLPPEIRDFCTPEVVTQVNQAYRENALKYPAGYVQTLAVLEARTVKAQMGYRQVRYRGLLSSRSVSAAQTSPIYLDCTFVIRSPTPLNAVGWRLVRVDAIAREAFYQPEREREIQKALALPPVTPMSRSLIAFAGLLGLAAAGFADEGAVLRPGVPMEVFVAPGRATTILFHTSEKAAAISLASPIITYKYDKALNQLEITPAVRAGGVETNLNVRIGPDVYVLVVKVVTDVRAQFVRSFDLESDAAQGDEAGLEQARPLKPEEIDIVGAAHALERAEGDPVFRQAHPNLRTETIGKFYQWNDCLIGLADLAQFLDQDLIVFRVQWVNRTNDALYLDAGQYGLFVHGQKIPVIARYKIGAGSVVYPGRLETVFLAVQGYRLVRGNDWQLGLPPDAGALTPMLTR